MARKLYMYAVTTSFLLVLGFPLIIYLYLPAKDISLSEKRKLADLPILKIDYDVLLDYPKEFNTYYQDHFGFRDELIRLNNYLKLILFNVSPSASVIKGVEGWYFYIGGGGIAADFYGMKQQGSSQLEEYTQVLLDRREWLNSIGVRYLFITVPNKINIYPEKLPERISQLSGVTMYDQLSEYIIKTTNADYIVNLKPILLKNKLKNKLYFLTDTHWNQLGALVSFNKIISQLRFWFPELETINHEEYTHGVVGHTGDLAYTMHLEDNISEISPLVKLTSPCSSIDMDKKLKITSSNRLLGSSTEGNVLIENGCNKNNLTALVIHDSFGNFLRPYFNERFNKVIYSNKSDINDLQKFIEKLKPDVLIDQRVERNLKKALVHDREIEYKAIKVQFDMSSSVAFDLQNYDFMTHEYTLHDLAITKIGSGYLLEASSNDPYITIPLQAGVSGSRYNAKIELTAPEDTFMQLFYTPVGAKNITSKNSIIRKIRKGYNQIYLHLPNQDIDGLIRFDPGVQAGRYTIHSLVIKENISAYTTQ